MTPGASTGEAEALEPAELEALYAWIDGVPLSRPKKNFARDFSDGVLVAEVVRHFVPRMVDMHNYIPAQSVAQKQSNWETVQAKLLKKLNDKGKKLKGKLPKLKGWQLSKRPKDWLPNKLLKLNGWRLSKKRRDWLLSKLKERQRF